MCASFPKNEFAQAAAVHRKFELDQKWLDAHWDEMMDAFKPICTKIASCLAVPGNDWVFCTDFMRWEFLATSSRYPEGTKDHDQWRMSSLVYFVGLDNWLMATSTESQKCATAEASPVKRQLKIWMQPEKIAPDFKGNLILFAVDSETHVPVKAHINVEGQKLPYANDSPDGLPVSFYPFQWPIVFTSATTPEGRRQLTVPNGIVTADGYETVTFPMPVDAPAVTVSMDPPASSLKTGKNTITVIASDARSGKPVELRVLAGDRILGNTNQPLTLELARGQKRPEIWATSLFKKYSDVVVAKGE
jgi:hypothetical protein